MKVQRNQEMVLTFIPKPTMIDSGKKASTETEKKKSLKKCLTHADSTSVFHSIALLAITDIGPSISEIVLEIARNQVRTEKSHHLKQQPRFET